MIAPCRIVMPRTVMGFDSLNDLLSQPVLLQQMTEGQDRGLIRHPIAHLDAGSAAHR